MEICVNPDLKLSGFQCVPQRLADFHLAWSDNQTRVERPPEDGVVFGIPREDAVGVGNDETMGREVAAKGQKSVAVGTARWRKKTIVVVDLVNHGAKVRIFP